MELIKKHYKLILCSIPFISFVLHFHVFNLDLVGIHVWRQTETQTVINNFYQEDMNIFYPRVNDFIYPDRVMRGEFPLMQWIFSLFYKIFGTRIAVTRVLSFIMGLFSVYGMFYLCDNVFKNKTIATICAWCFNFSPVFYYYTLNPMPDNMALCCGIWSIAFFYSYTNVYKIKYLVWSALFLGLATLVKLPFVLYGSFIFVFIFEQLRNKKYNMQEVVCISSIYLLFIFPSVIWYIMVLPSLCSGLLMGFFDVKQSFAGWAYILQGSIVSVLPELLINYASVVFLLLVFIICSEIKCIVIRIFICFFSGELLSSFILFMSLT